MEKQLCVSDVALHQRCVSVKPWKPNTRAIQRQMRVNLETLCVIRTEDRLKQCPFEIKHTCEEFTPPNHMIHDVAA